MAGLAEVSSGLVFARMNCDTGEFIRGTALGDREDLPDGIIAGPVLLAERGIGGTIPMIRRHVGQTALVIVEHQIDGSGSGLNAKGLCEAIARAKADALLIRPESVNAAEAHITAMNSVDAGIPVIVGPPRVQSYSQRPSLGVDQDTASWKKFFADPIEHGARNFYMPASGNGTFTERDIVRINSWSEQFGAFAGIIGDYTLWLDGVHDTEGGMTRLLQATGAGQNVNVIVSQFGNEPLTNYVASIRSGLA